MRQMKAWGEHSVKLPKAQLMSKDITNKQGTRYLRETKLAVELALALIEERNKHLEQIVSLSGTAIADTAEEADRLAWETYEKNRTKIEAFAKELNAKEYSTAVMAGAVLQIAKQGLSLVLGGKPTPPLGRQIRGVHVSDIIWASRNQALHFEEGEFNQHTYAVFEKWLFRLSYGSLRSVNMSLRPI